MYIASVTRQVLMYGGATAVIVGVLWLVRSRRKPALADPDAAPPRVATWARVTPAALLVVGAIAAYWSYRHSLEVVLVTDVDGKPQVEHKLASGIDEPVAPGAWSEPHNSIVPYVWLVNRSTKTVRVETVYYDTSGTAPDDPPVAFPPDTAGVFYSIDYVGPNDHPPDRVIGSRMLGAAKTWLTW